MKLSIVTTFSSKRSDPWKEALLNYSELADEVVVVYDPEETEITKYIESLHRNIVPVHMDWPYDFSWSEFPRHYNAGLEKAQGDWVIKLDIDLLIHENDFRNLCIRLSGSDAPVASLEKRSVYGDKYFSKGGVINCLNKGKYPELRFGGQMGNIGNDDLVGIIDPETMEKEGVWYGTNPTPVLRTGIEFWNFDYTFKAGEDAVKQFIRMCKAYQRFHMKSLLGEDFVESDENYKQKFYELQEAKKIRAINPISIDQVPKHIMEKYKENLKI